MAPLINKIKHYYYGNICYFYLFVYRNGVFQM